MAFQVVRRRDKGKGLTVDVESKIDQPYNHR